MIIDRVARIGGALLLGALIEGGALAQTPATPAVPAAGQMGYLNGGIGEEQADLMRDMSSQFPVRFTFSRHNGTHNTDEFVADVRLRVVDSAGQTVLNLAQQGPIFLLRLPEGAYTVEAEHNGELKSRRFQVVSGRHQEIAFSWAG
ncbi:MAG: hypothetical protein ACM34F_01195 [Betaproteobacteria bacterium]|jgi:hypothetical protein|nr:hypothetical protein [Casimicrobiaceae bacterium]